MSIEIYSVTQNALCEIYLIKFLLMIFIYIKKSTFYLFIALFLCPKICFTQTISPSKDKISNKFYPLKTKGGLQYQIFTNNDINKASKGNYLKISLTQTVNDSTLFTNFNQLPLYILVSDPIQDYDISEMFIGLHKGDSLACIQHMDTFLKRLPMGSLPKSFKSGDTIFTTFKVHDVFPNDSLKKIDETLENAIFNKKESDYVENFLRHKSSSIFRTQNGTFIEIKKQGQGEYINTGDSISIKIIAKTFNGINIVSFFDSTSNNVGQISLKVGANQILHSFDESLKYLKKGAQATFYVPSYLGYGMNPPQESKIKPFEHLIFELIVENVWEKTIQLKNSTLDFTDPSSVVKAFITASRKKDILLASLLIDPEIAPNELRKIKNLIITKDQRLIEELYDIRESYINGSAKIAPDGKTAIVPVWYKSSIREHQEEVYLINRYGNWLIADF